MYIYRHSENEKKVIVLNKQMQREREREKGEREVLKRQTTIFHTLLYSSGENADRNHRRERGILTAVEKIVRTISWTDA